MPYVCLLRARAAARVHAGTCSNQPNTNPYPHRPQGCYDIGLPSRKSLFQLQAERLGALQALAAKAAGGAGKPLRWYIMTSAFTHADTV